jgi:hypothetical protein
MNKQNTQCNVQLPFPPDEEGPLLMYSSFLSSLTGLFLSWPFTHRWKPVGYYLPPMRAESQFRVLKS